MRIIAGTARSRTFETPKGRDTRPTLDRVRENLFNIIAGRVPGARVLDLFSGSGALALEALSRGAAHAVLVDHDRAAHLCEARNIATLGFESQAEALLCDWRQALRRLGQAGQQFDLVFLDPPYAMGDLTQVCEALRPLLCPAALVVTEHQAEHPYLMSAGLTPVDSRRWGYVGVTMYTLSGEENA